VPVRSLTRLSTNEKYVFSNSGSETGKLIGLARLMMQIQRGKATDTEGWLWEITGFPQPAPAPSSLSILGSFAQTVFGKVMKISAAA
jgi:hypothetical protein